MAYGVRQPLAGKRAVFSLGIADKVRGWWKGRKDNDATMGRYDRWSGGDNELGDSFQKIGRRG